MHNKTRVSLESCLYSRRLVCAIVIHNQCRSRPVIFPACHFLSVVLAMFCLMPGKKQVRRKGSNMWSSAEYFGSDVYSFRKALRVISADPHDLSSPAYNSPKFNLPDITMQYSGAMIFHAIGNDFRRYKHDCIHHKASRFGKNQI